MNALKPNQSSECTYQTSSYSLMLAHPRFDVKTRGFNYFRSVMVHD